MKDRGEKEISFWVTKRLDMILFVRPAKLSVLHYPLTNSKNQALFREFHQVSDFEAVEKSSVV